MDDAGKFSTREIPLTAIDLRRLDPVRQVLRRYADQDHSRWVFRGRVPGIDDMVFVKIWNPGYVRRDTLPSAVEAGLYASDTTPALRGLLTSNGLCRGYVMAACRRRLWMSRSFFRRVCARTVESGYFSVQFSPAHTLRLNGRLSMIDLEGAYPLSKLALVSAHFSAFAYRPYAAFVARHLRTDMPPVETRPTPAARLARHTRPRATTLMREEFRPDLIDA